jgi:hypothetical protein
MKLIIQLRLVLRLKYVEVYSTHTSYAKSWCSIKHYGAEIFVRSGVAQLVNKYPHPHPLLMKHEDS